MERPKLYEFHISENVIPEIESFNKKQETLAWRTTHILIIAVGLFSAIYFGPEGLFVSLVPYLSIWGVFLLQLLVKKSFYPNHPSTKNLENYREKLHNYELYERKLTEDFWFSLSGYQFEMEITKILQPFFKEVILTKGSGDGGVDIIINNYDETRIIIQCKAHKKPIGPESVRALVGVMGQFNATKGVFIALGGFSKGAKEVAMYAGLYMMDLSDVIKIHKSSEWRELEFAGIQYHYSVKDQL
jgi:hypothetical protein